MYEFQCMKIENIRQQKTTGKGDLKITIVRFTLGWLLLLKKGKEDKKCKKANKREVLMRLWKEVNPGALRVSKLVQP